VAHTHGSDASVGDDASVGGDVAQPSAAPGPLRLLPLSSSAERPVPALAAPPLSSPALSQSPASPPLLLPLPLPLQPKRA
jgi:hypothetical protein